MHANPVNRGLVEAGGKDVIEWGAAPFVFKGAGFDVSFGRNRGRRNATLAPDKRTVRGKKETPENRLVMKTTAAGEKSE